jgi:hypothetical protein
MKGLLPMPMPVNESIDDTGLPAKVDILSASILLGILHTQTLVNPTQEIWGPETNRDQLALWVGFAKVWVNPIFCEAELTILLPFWKRRPPLNQIVLGGKPNKNLQGRLH